MSVGTGDEGMESTLAGLWAGQRRASPCCILPPFPGQHPDWAAGTLAGRLWVASKLRQGHRLPWWFSRSPPSCNSLHPFSLAFFPSSHQPNAA